MTGEGVFIADLEDGCPAAAGWVAYWDHLTLPLTGQDLADAQATLAGWDDPSSPQGGLGDCWGCAAQVARLRALVDQATSPPPRGRPAMSRAQHILAVIVGLITGVLLMESYGAMVDAARAGGRAIPELWPLGTEALALAMEVSVLEAKRLGHRAVLRLSWLLLVASVALSTLLQVAVAPPTLVGYLTAGATPVWLLGSFAVLSLLYRTPAPPPTRRPTRPRQPAGEEPSKRERARQAYAALVAAGQPVTGARLAEAADISASYGRALLADFQADPTLAAARPTGSGPSAEVGER